jgi:hypothetical protein
LVPFSERNISSSQRIGVISRSATPAAAEKWKEQGVDLRVIDVTTASEEKLIETLQGVNILLSVTAAFALETQQPLFAAAAKVPSITRVIPSDFGPPCPPGVSSLQDRVQLFAVHAI